MGVHPRIPQVQNQTQQRVWLERVRIALSRRGEGWKELRELLRLSVGFLIGRPCLGFDLEQLLRLSRQLAHCAGQGEVCYYVCVSSDPRIFPSPSSCS